jgi:activator of 2-hydroxyglutaryl-CoA dehydratase
MNSGVTTNIRVPEALEGRLRSASHLVFESQVTGAVGAALTRLDRATS